MEKKYMMWGLSFATVVLIIAMIYFTQFRTDNSVSTHKLNDSYSEQNSLYRNTDASSTTTLENYNSEDNDSNGYKLNEVSVKPIDNTPTHTSSIETTEDSSNLSRIETDIDFEDKNSLLQKYFNIVTNVHGENDVKNLTVVEMIIASNIAKYALNFPEFYDEFELQQLVPFQKQIEERLDDESPIFFGTSLLGEQIIAVRQPLKDYDFKDYLEAVNHYCACDYNYTVLKQFSATFEDYVAYEVIVLDSKYESQLDAMYSIWLEKGEQTPLYTFDNINDNLVTEWKDKHSISYEWSEGKGYKSKFFIHPYGQSIDYLVFGLGKEHVALFNNNMKRLMNYEMELKEKEQP